MVKVVFQSTSSNSRRDRKERACDEDTKLGIKLRMSSPWFNEQKVWSVWSRYVTTSVSAQSTLIDATTTIKKISIVTV